MGRILRDNGLTLALAALFLISLTGQVATGFDVENAARVQHGQAMFGLLTYLHSGHFISAVFENWESEFLQMATFVVLTAHLYQRGSPESRDPDAPAQDDAVTAASPWPVRVGGLARRVYAHSLGLTLALLFAASFALHALGSTRLAGEEALQHGEAAPSLLQHLTSAGFWFESFQNWQSEFLSTGLLVVLAIFLRERGSPESKRVAAPHAQTGAG